MALHRGNADPAAAEDPAGGEGTARTSAVPVVRRRGGDCHRGARSGGSTGAAPRSAESSGSRHGGVASSMSTEDPPVATGRVLRADGEPPPNLRNLAGLAELEAGWPAAAAGTALAHTDIRADNILLTQDRVVFVDWPWACIAAPWFDLLTMLPSVLATLAGFFVRM